MKRSLKVLMTSEPSMDASVLKGLPYNLTMVPPDAASILAATDDKHPDIVLVDIALYRGHFIENFRRQHATLPILVLVGPRSRPHANLLALADDVLFQPLDPRELRFRIDKALSRDRPFALLPLHDARSGRLDAKRIASYIGIPLKDLSTALGRDYKTVFKTPAAPALQTPLAPFARTIHALHRYFSRQDESLAWLSTPNPELDSERPLELLLQGKAAIVADMLEGALAGVTA